MRTNIVLNEELIERALEYSDAKSKRALIEEALLLFLQVKEAEQNLLDYEDQYQKILKKTDKIRISQSSVDIIRKDRDEK